MVGAVGLLACGLLSRAAFSNVGDMPVLFIAGAVLAGAAAFSGLPTGISHR
jgi:hypothetical protein